MVEVDGANLTFYCVLKLIVKFVGMLLDHWLFFSTYSPFIVIKNVEGKMKNVGETGKKVTTFLIGGTIGVSSKCGKSGHLAIVLFKK